MIFFGLIFQKTITAEFLRQKGFAIDLDMKYQNIDLTSAVDLREKQEVFVGDVESCQ